MRIEIWSDIVCPWCYIGKRRFESALTLFAHRDEVEVVWRAFELDPSAPAEREGAYADRLAEKYGTTVAAAELMISSMSAAAAADGLDFRFDRARPGNTFDAHRLLQLAGERGRQGELKERLFRAYLTEGESIGASRTLLRLAQDVGLDRDEVWEVLDSDAYADAVRVEEATATNLGVQGVPFFVVDRRYGISGAQPANVILDVLERAWSERLPETVVGAAAGPGCDGDDCAI